MKKLLILLLFAPNFLLAIPLTLSEYIAKNPSWNSSDRPSLSYITLRCGVLFEQISELYKNNVEEQETYKIAPTDAINFFGCHPIFIKRVASIMSALKLKKKTHKKRKKNGH